MKKILVLIGRYLPGYKDGGPIRTWINVTEALGDEYQFCIATLDRDRGDDHPYPGIRYNEWNCVGKARVWYVKQFSVKLIRKLAQEADLVYSCGFYDHYGYSALILNRLRLLCGKPLVVAPMGTFSAGALSHNALKKKLFINGCKWLGLFNNMKWSVTSELELADVRKNIGNTADCIIAEDLPRTNVPGIAARRAANNVLRLVFLSRICPQKNLLGAIKCLEQVRSEVEFTIFGPREDAAYWESCKSRLEKLPGNIRWYYAGDVPSEDVQRKFQQNDVFLFPTLGENYGHVIFEALSVGCIPVISDQTPWGIIAEKNAGYVLRLSEKMTDFAEALDQLSEMEAHQRMQMAERAVQIAWEKVERSKRETGYRIIFG